MVQENGMSENRVEGRVAKKDLVGEEKVAEKEVEQIG